MGKHSTGRLAGAECGCIITFAPKITASGKLDDKYLATADRIFELAKRARSLWNQRSPAEERQLLEVVLSNPVLDGATVRWEMKKPFAILAEMTNGSAWRARSDSNARPSDS